MKPDRRINTLIGEFKFFYVDYPGPSGMINIFFNDKNLGYFKWVDLDKASDIELLSLLVINE